MRAAVVVYPGSNCDRDLAVALRLATGAAPTMVWHKETALPDGLDLVAIPGGFSFGDYLRCGAIAAAAPITAAILRHVARGGYALGVCNGFQVLTETGLLPGALLRNAGIRFVCRLQALRVEATSAFTAGWGQGAEIALPIAHHDGNYVADPEMLTRLRGENRVALRYLGNPNGSADDIAGVLSDNRRVLGLMPHPERRLEPLHGGTDGRRLFDALAGAAITLEGA